MSILNSGTVKQPFRYRTKRGGQPLIMPTPAGRDRTPGLELPGLSCRGTFHWVTRCLDVGSELRAMPHAHSVRQSGHTPPASRGLIDGNKKPAVRADPMQ